MVKKKIIIVRIAEGLGNQLFMFSNAYALAKIKKYLLMIDDESKKKKFFIRFF